MPLEDFRIPVARGLGRVGSAPIEPGAVGDVLAGQGSAADPLFESLSDLMIEFGDGFLASQKFIDAVLAILEEFAGDVEAWALIAQAAAEDAEEALVAVLAALASVPSPESVEALLSATQVIGLAENVGTGSAVGNSVWVIGGPAEQDSTLSRLRINNPQSSGGTVKFKRMTVDGAFLWSRQGGQDYDIEIPAGPGWVEAVAADFGVIPLMEGEYPGLYVGFDPGGGLLQYMGHQAADQPNNGYFRSAGGSGNVNSFTDIAPTLDDQLLVGFDLAYVVLTADNFVALQDRLTLDEVDLDTLRSGQMTEKTYSLGRQQTPIAGDAPAGQATTMFSLRNLFDSDLESILVRCHSAGTMVFRFFDREVLDLDVTSPYVKQTTFECIEGLNTYPMDLFVPAGWMVAWYGPVAINTDVKATLTYTGETSPFHIFEGPGDLLTGHTSGATAAIIEISDAGSTGTLTLSLVDGTFVNGELITDNEGGSATANVFTPAENFPADSCGVMALTGDRTSGTITIGSPTMSVRYEIQFNLRRRDFGRENVGVMPGQQLPPDEAPPAPSTEIMRVRPVIGESTAMGSRSMEFVFDPSPPRDTVVAFGGITRSAPLNTKSTGLVQAALTYNTQTEAFDTGTSVTLQGATSGAQARCLGDVNAGATGTLTLSRCVGTFVNGEIVAATGAFAGSATVDTFVPTQSTIGPVVEVLSDTDNNWANNYESLSVDRGNTGWVQAAYAIQDGASAQLSVTQDENRAHLVLSGWGGERLDHRDGIGEGRKWNLLDELLRSVKDEYGDDAKCLTVCCVDGPNNAAQGIVIDQNRPYVAGDFDLTIANFEAQLIEFYTRTRALVRSIFDRGGPVRFILVPTSLYVRGSGSFSLQPRRGMVQQACVNASKKLSWLDCPSTDFENQCCPQDSVHFSAQGSTTHANQYVQPILDSEFWGIRPVYARPLGARALIGGNTIEWTFWSPKAIEIVTASELIAITDQGMAVTVDDPDAPVVLETRTIDNEPGLAYPQLRVIRQDIATTILSTSDVTISMGMHYGRAILAPVGGVRPPGSGKDDEGYHQFCETGTVVVDCDGTPVTCHNPLPICQATVQLYSE